MKKSQTNRLTAVEINDALDIVREVFAHFRPLIMERAGKSAYTDKQDGSPVTDTDMEIELALQAALTRRFPDVPVFGEETGYGTDWPAAFWLVDPIDGTKSFIAAIPAFTCMAVFIQDGEALASVIYNPSSDDWYVAQKGKGAHKNGKRLDLHATPLPAVALSKEAYFAPLNAMLEPKKIVCEETPSGGGYGFTLVADGLAAARFNLRSRGSTHDYAPGALLVQEAGGVLLPVQDEVYTFETRSFVAAHPALEPILHAHLHQLRDLESKK